MSKKIKNEYTLWQFIKERVVAIIILIAIPLIGIAVFVPLLCCDKIPINDLGSFLGGLLAYLGTVLLGLISVWQNEKFKKMSDYKDELREAEIKESQRLSIQPYLFCEYEEKIFETLSSMVKLDLILVDNFDTEGNGYPFYDGVPSFLQMALNDRAGFKPIRNAQKYILTKFNITNIGQAGAVDILLEINNRKTLTPFSMIKESTKTIYILFDIEDNIEGEKEISFDFFYNDIQGDTKYKQQFLIDICKNKDDFGYTSQQSGISAPTIVN